jgi:hypothetical protein
MSKEVDPERKGLELQIRHAGADRLAENWYIYVLEKGLE